LSYRGKREGGYGDSRRRSSPVVRYYRGIRGTRDLSALPQYDLNHAAPEDTQQGQTQTQPPELWLKALPSLTFEGFAFKFTPKLEDSGRTAGALASFAKTKKKLELEIRDPQNSKTLKRFKIVKTEEADPLQAGLLDLEAITDDQTRKYISSLKMQLESLDYTILEVLN
jgi:hypothetical protein